MARKPADSKVLSRRVLVLIDRDMTAKTPRVVWQHEIPILEAVFGEGKVIPQEPKILDEGYTGKTSPDLLPHNKVQDMIQPPSLTNGLDWVFVGDPRSEYDRLGSVYGSMPDENRLYVENVYGRFQEGRFEAVVGAAEVEDLPEPQLRDLIKGYGFLPTVDPTSPDVDKQVARDKQKQLQAAKHDELVKIAQDLGVMLA